MLPTDAQSVWAILLAIVPGFLATSVWSRTKTWRGPPDDIRMILQALALSAVIQLALAPLTIHWLVPVRGDLERYPERLAVWTTLAVLVMPVIGGVLVGKLSDQIFNARSAALSGRLSKGLATLWPPAPPPSIWDWVFTARPPQGQFLLIEYKDGKRIAGAFAEGSVALTSPQPHGLFMVEEWEVDEDGNIIEEIPGTAGVTILATDEIRSIRVLEAGDANVQGE